MTGRQAFRNGFLLGAAFCAGTCLAGCTSTDRAGHRLEASLLRLDPGGSSSDATLNVDGPGGNGGTLTKHEDSSDPGWAYGLAYSIPMGESQEAEPLRLMVAHLAGLRADVDRLTAAVDGQTEALALEAARRRADRSQPVEPPVATPEPPPVVVAPEPVVAPEGPTEPVEGSETKAQYAVAAAALASLAAFLARKAIMAFLRAKLPKLFGGTPDDS